MPAPEYAIRRSPRARRVRITVEPSGEVWVVLPRDAPAREAARAVTELAPWIERRRRQAQAAREAVAARAGTVPYLGIPLRLVAQPGRTRVRRCGDSLLVPVPDPGPALERFYRRAARLEAAPRLERACAALGTAHAGLSIRAQRTRWGSCSATGAISLNWRLLLAPEPVLDYVVWHEACHLVVRDHSPRFWALLTRHCPQARAHAAWLRRHGATLVLG